MPRGPITIASLLAAATIVGTVAWLTLRGLDRAQEGVAAGMPSGTTTRPTTTTSATTAPAVPTNYLALVRAADPSVKQTELLTVPIDLAEAAHLRLPNPVYICGRGDLWITQPDAVTDTATTLASAFDSQTHLVRERIEFVWWRADGDGAFKPFIASRTTKGYEWTHPGGTVPMATDLTLDWPRAIFWRDDAVIVPSARGVAIVQAEHDATPGQPRFAVDHVDLIEGVTATTAPPPLFVTDAQGVVAWVPADERAAYGQRVARYVDGRWADLDPQEWPASIVHVVPLVDGSVLRLTADGPRIRIALAPLAAGAVDEAQVAALVEQLSEPDPRLRTVAFQRLTQFGPGAWPVLERLRDEQPFEARLRIGQVLRDRTAPTLAGMSAVDDEMRVVARDRAGGVVLFADKGMSVPDAGGKTSVVSPAWVAVRPGRVPELLPAPMVADLQPDRHRLEAYKNEWILRDAVHGARRYLGRQWQPLLRDDERDFDRLVGVDGRGRWVFARSEPILATTTTASAATYPSTAANTLIIDPTLPDPTPRLPGWAISDAKSAGWTDDGWPAVTFDGKDYRLTDTGWARLDPKRSERLITDLPPTPTTAPATLTVANGKRYLDGTTAIIVRQDGEPDVVHPLPTEAQGGDVAHLVASADDALLLMNTPGRIVLLRKSDATPGLTIAATFTRKVPSGLIRRYWLDPAGRLCIAHDTTGLTIFFPKGIIPPPIRKMMPHNELSEAGEP